MISFVFDTSAFLSLESISILDIALKNFSIVTSNFVFHELGDFAAYNDTLGRIAQQVLNQKDKIAVEKPFIKEHLGFVSETDNGIFNIALSKDIALITDDIKLARHCVGKIDTEFSTFFLLAFVDAGLLTKTESLQKLEKMRNIRNWQDNIIYISTKEELDTMKE